MRYGIIGLGPIGSTMAVLLRQAGHPVSALCGYEKKFEALKAAPVKLTGLFSASAEFTDVFNRIDEFLDSQPDVVLISTKCCDSPAVLKAMKESRPQFKGVIVSCQNGLDVEQQIVETFGSSQALRMVMNLGANLLNENLVNLVFCMSQYLSVRKSVDFKVTQQIAADLNATGFKVELREDYFTEVFRKVILNSSMGTVCAMTGLTMKGVLDDSHLSGIVKTMVQEGISVAKAMNLSIEPEFLNDAIAYMKKGGDHKPSIAVDLANDRPTENEAHCGAICRYAEKYHIDVPVTQTFYHLTRSREVSNRK